MNNKNSEVYETEVQPLPLIELLERKWKVLGFAGIVVVSAGLLLTYLWMNIWVMFIILAGLGIMIFAHQLSPYSLRYHSDLFEKPEEIETNINIKEEEAVYSD